MGTFPDGNSALMQVCAKLRHVAGTQWGNKKYMNMKHLEAVSFSLMLLRTVAGYALLPDSFQQLLRFAVLLHSARVRRKLRQLRRWE